MAQSRPLGPLGPIDNGRLAPFRLSAIYLVSANVEIPFRGGSHRNRHSFTLAYGTGREWIRDGSIGLDKYRANALMIAFEWIHPRALSCLNRKLRYSSIKLVAEGKKMHLNLDPNELRCTNRH